MLRWASLIISALVALAPSILAQPLEDEFTLDLKQTKGIELPLEFRLCYRGMPVKEFGAILSTDVRPLSGGTWKYNPPSDSIVGTGTGSFGPITLKKGDCIPVWHGLNDLFTQVSAGKNTIVLELTLRVLNDKKTIKLRASAEVDLTPEQIEYVRKRQ